MISLIIEVFDAMIEEEERRKNMSDGMTEMCREEAMSLGLEKGWAYPQKQEDVVNRPNHYQLFGNLEVIDAIRELLTPEEFRGYLKGNVLKYRLRAGKKDNVEQDIKKALKYEGWLDK